MVKRAQIKQSNTECTQTEVKMRKYKRCERYDCNNFTVYDNEQIYFSIVIKIVAENALWLLNHSMIRALLWHLQWLLTIIEFHYITSCSIVLMVWSARSYSSLLFCCCFLCFAFNFIYQLQVVSNEIDEMHFK